MKNAVSRGAAAWLAAVLGAATLPAHADEADRPAVSSPLYRDECGTCHVAFAPRLLPAQSWQRVMGQLSSHYAVDASIDAARARELLAWLQAHAADGRRAAVPPHDRITESAWFLSEHKEVPAAVWQRPAVRKPSNCGACHTRAGEGSFRERDIVIPR